MNHILPYGEPIWGRAAAVNAYGEAFAQRPPGQSEGTFTTPPGAFVPASFVLD